jgi:hypothetical protein
MAVGYKIYIHTNTDQPERHKYKMKSINMTRKNITYKAGHRLDSNKNKNKNLTNMMMMMMFT